MEFQQLRIRYRGSPAVAEGSPRLRRGPKAGDRLPDLPVGHGSEETWLHQELGPWFLLLLCGRIDAWDRAAILQLRERFGRTLVIRHLTTGRATDALIDATGEALRRLGVKGTAQYPVRPDGHIGFRCAGPDVGGVARYLERWL